MEKKYTKMDLYKNKIETIYRSMGKLNLYCSMCKIRNERVYNDLINVRNLIDEFIEEELQEEKKKAQDE
ncbi:MAG: hypothetical protein E7391_01105 [Ruminococcaceae bacterium]|nr:hypothetical protein [Oscillospiraceae bacterium]